MKTLKTLRIGLTAFALTIAAVAVSAVATGQTAHAGEDPCDDPGSFCIRVGSGGDSEISVRLAPDRGTYRVGQEVEICARPERTGLVTFTNRKNGRLRELPVSAQVSAGREFCFNGEIERGDECVGATLRSGGRTYTADEVCFNVR